MFRHLSRPDLTLLSKLLMMQSEGRICVPLEQPVCFSLLISLIKLETLDTSREISIQDPDYILPLTVHSLHCGHRLLGVLRDGVDLVQPGAPQVHPLAGPRSSRARGRPPADRGSQRGMSRQIAPGAERGLSRSLMVH